jgi:hypothetical protein
LSWQYGTIIVHALEFTKWATWTKFQHSSHTTFMIDSTSWQAYADQTYI